MAGLGKLAMLAMLVELAKLADKFGNGDFHSWLVGCYFNIILLTVVEILKFSLMSCREKYVTGTTLLKRCVTIT